MIDILGIITRAWLGLHVPAAANVTPAVGSAASQPATAPTSANEVVDRVQKFYAGIKQVTAQFRQTVRNETFGNEQKSDGMVWLMKPGKMRWDYLEKKNGQTLVKKSFISDGNTLWVVEHDNKQVIKKNLQQDLMPVAVSFLYGKGDLKQEFNAEIDKSGAYGGVDDIVLKLTPKQPSAQYKNLYLVVNKKDFHVSQSVIIDSSNNMNHFEFYAPDFEKPIKDTWFQFNPASVPNYRVIDADQAQQGGSPIPPPKKP